MNIIAGGLPEFGPIFEGFSPINMIIDRIGAELSIDASALENITLATFSNL